MTGPGSVDRHRSSGPARPRRAAVVVVNYGSHRLIERNLPLMAGLAEVIVVDNPTTDAERRDVLALCGRQGWSLLQMPRNVGFGAAVNAAVRDLADDVDTVLVVNPDCAIGTGVISQLVAAARADPGALITPALVDATGRPAFVGAMVSLRTGEIRGAASDRPLRRVPALVRGAGSPAGAEWVPGTCLAMSRTLFESLGGFDETYFLYWEDVDLSYRCVLAGGRLVVQRDLYVVHDSGGTQGVQHGRAKSAVYYRYNCRNRLLFAARHLDRRSRLAWALLAPMVGREILLRGGRRQLVRSWRPWWAALSGTVEGLRLLVSAPAPVGIGRYEDGRRVPSR